jgi:hypothetical protein
MPLLSLNLKPRLPVRPETDLRPIRLRVRFDNLGRGLLPGRGLVYSFLTHELIVAILLFWPAIPGRDLPHRQPIDESADSGEVIYLPNLGGGSEGNGYQGGGSLIQRKGAAVDATRATEGFSYPGPQPILSDAPKPTNHIQTILRPALKNPPVLKSFVDVPNIVQPAIPVTVATIADNPEPARPLPQISPLKPKAPAPTDVKSPNVPNLQPAIPVPVPTIADSPEPARPLPQLSPLKPKAPASTDVKSPNVPNLQPAIPVPVPTIADSPEPARPLPQLSPLKPKTTSPTDRNSPEPPPPIVPATTMPPDQAKLTFPIADKPQRPLPPQMGAPKPTLQKAEDLQAAPKIPPLQARGTEVQSLLALSPAPALPQQSVNIPPGESRGRFAISPEPNVDSSQPEPGSKIGDSHSQAVAVGSVTDAPSGNTAAVGPAGVSNGIVRLAIGGAGGLGTNTGSETGAGSGGNGLDNGRGSRAGARLGEGPAGSSGGGKGAGAGKNGGAFPGITIQGGTLQGENGADSVSSTSFAAAPKSTYGMTIVSTASSGGGLPDFGTFSHEQVYTVFLDMRRTAEDPAPTWTLQCALLQSSDAQDDARTSSQSLTNGLVPPFPLIKGQPDLSPELVRQNLGKLIVVYGIVNASGRFEQMSVKQSPDVRFNGPILEQLSKWVFRPAELNGTPVAVKTLLGFSLSPSGR